jgi:hypothetical protein
VCRCLLSLLAKRAKATIVPTAFLKAVGRPKPTADSQPRKKLDLQRCPSLPNQPMYASSRGPAELCLIYRVGKVLTTRRYLPSNSFFNLLLEVDGVEEGPKHNIFSIARNR